MSNSGVAVHFEPSIILSLCAIDQQSRFLCAQLPVSTTTFQVCNIYGPNTSAKGALFFESLYPVIDLALPLYYVMISILLLMLIKIVAAATLYLHGHVIGHRP